MNFTSPRIRPLLFFICTLFAEVSPKLVELCMETLCLCPSEGHKHGGCKVTETSVTEFAMEMKHYYSRAPTHKKHSSVSKNSKSYTCNSSFDLCDSLLGSQFSCHAMLKLGNLNMIYYKKKNSVKLKYCEASSSCKT